ncbi:MAG TPA: hypothetical protein VJG32_13000 [Anaerolineae bacterium]|nr:hypothetical protein [Anaerolineae bacterium]
MPLKVRNAKKRLTTQPHYLVQLRLDIELDQGYPLTTAQDLALKQMVAEGSLTVQAAAEQLIALRPKSTLNALRMGAHE